MSAIDIALPRLEVEEGFRATAYRDTNGLLTIGYGLCVDRGISQAVAAAALRAQIQESHDSLSRYPWYAGLDDVRQGACLDMAINLGIAGLLRFPSLIHYLGLKDWVNAAKECHVEDPKLASRYAGLAQIFLTGVA